LKHATEWLTYVAGGNRFPFGLPMLLNHIEFCSFLPDETKINFNEFDFSSMLISSHRISGSGFLKRIYSDFHSGEYHFRETGEKLVH
jgi:hypothetical protein